VCNKVKNSIKIISLLTLITILFIVIISCITGVKFSDLAGSSNIGFIFMDYNPNQNRYYLIRN